ncbi:MAG: PepSY-associated TM helix domain-containing protein [Vicinamibacterales bacterium]
MSRRHRTLISRRAYALFWDAHSVVGVFTGLALFVMFFCGALALYRGELHQWADPALRTQTTQVASIDAMLAPLFDAHPLKPGGGLVLTWPFGDRPYFHVNYETASGRVAHWIAPQSRETLPEIGRSRLPDILNDLHFFGQLGTAGRLLAGVVGLVCLFALVTGLAIHLHKLPQDLHTFRPRERLRVSLADAHAVLGTVGIPFTAMYALTGAYFSLLLVVYGGLVFGTLGGDRQRLGDLIGGFNRPVYQAAHVTSPSLSFDALLARFRAEYADAPPFIMEIEGWNDAAGLVTFEANANRSLGSTAIATLRATTGEIVAGRGSAHTPAMTETAAAFGVLHFARFGGHLLKAIFFVLALAASAVMLTGNVLWLEVRRSQHRDATPWLHRMLARLTSGVGAGLVAAVPLLFLTTRVVPIEQPGRMAVEEGMFFGAWALFIVVAQVVPSAKTSAALLIVVGGLLAVAVPFADAWCTGAWPWALAQRGYWTVFGVDGSFLLAGALLCWIAYRMLAVSTRK